MRKLQVECSAPQLRMTMELKFKERNACVQKQFKLMRLPKKKQGSEEG